MRRRERGERETVRVRLFVANCGAPPGETRERLSPANGGSVLREVRARPGTMPARLEDPGNPFWTRTGFSSSPPSPRFLAFLAARTTPFPVRVLVRRVPHAASR